MLCKQDNHLFRRSTRSAYEVLLQRGEFADEVVLLAQSKLLPVMLSEFMWKWLVLWG